MDGVAAPGTATPYSREDHVHPSDTTKADVATLSETIDDRVASLLVAGSNVTLTYNDPANTLTIASTGGGGGGSGTTILDGTGAPATGLGAVDDYYVDTSGNAMYGPKLPSGSHQPPEHGIPDALVPASSSASALELGAKITISVSGIITAIRVYRAADNPITRSVGLWTTAGVNLATASTSNDGSGGGVAGWIEVALTTPYTVTAGTTLVASYSNTSGSFVRTDSGVGLPISNGGHVSIVDTSYGVTLGSFPGTAFGANFFCDVVFQADVTVFWPIAVTGSSIGNPVISGTSGSVLYADASGNLAQDSTFKWVDATNDLKVGGTYYINATPALYVVPNGSGDNWFEGSAGNLSVTGHDNFGTGTQCLQYLTTGYGNTGVGTGSMANITTGFNNFAFGTLALRTATSGSNNTAIGPSTMQNGIAINSNVAIGQNALIALGGGGGAENANVAIGNDAYAALQTGGGNVAIGAGAATSMTDATGGSNVFIGYQSALNTVGSNLLNTCVGAFAGRGINNMQGCTVLGPWSGPGSNLNGIITINDGNSIFAASPKMDYGYTTAGRWTAASDFAINGAYYVNAARALYVVPNVTENNWFEGNAGNQTVSGYGNFGTGDLSLSSLTSGYDNVSVGTNAGRHLTSGYRNFALGTNALSLTLSDADNTAIGTGALAQLGTGGAGSGGNTSNVAIGIGAMGSTQQGNNNVAMGFTALGAVTSPTTATFNVVVGSGAGNALGTGGGSSVHNNIMVGANAGANLSGASSNNTFVGGWAGPSGSGNDKCALSTGGGQGLFDLGITGTWRWSLSFKGYGLPTGLHIYNTQDALGVANNYERACIDWVDVSNVLRIGAEAGGTGTLRLTAFIAYPKAGAPAASDLPSGTFAVIDDTSANQTWLVFNKSGTIRKVQLT